MKLTATSLTVTRRPNGGGALRFFSSKDLIELELDADAWSKLEESVRWHAGIELTVDLEERVRRLEEKLK